MMTKSEMINVLLRFAKPALISMMPFPLDIRIEPRFNWKNAFLLRWPIEWFLVMREEHGEEIDMTDHYCTYKEAEKAMLKILEISFFSNGGNCDDGSLFIFNRKPA